MNEYRNLGRIYATLIHSQEMVWMRRGKRDNDWQRREKKIRIRQILSVQEKQLLYLQEQINLGDMKLLRLERAQSKPLGFYQST